MLKQLFPIRRQAFVAATFVALASGAICTYVVRADDPKLAADSAVTPDESKMAMDQLDQMKKEAANSADAEKMTKNMAKMMVMDSMARGLAKDPQFKAAFDQTMSDENMKKVHDDAKSMADNDDEMKKMKDDIMGNEKAMREVVRQAAMMESMMEMHPGMGGKSMSDMGKSMMDKMQSK